MTELMAQTSQEHVVAPPATSKFQFLAHARKRSRMTTMVLQVVVALVILGIWELLSGRFIPELMISRPSAFIPQFVEWLRDGTLASATWATFSTAMIGLALGLTAGMIVGIVLGQSKFLGDILEPFITALYTLPKFALIPLFIMWVGVGSSLGVITSAVIAFFLVFFNTFFGIRDVRQSLVNSVRVMGGSQWQILTHVRLPSALIWVFAGLKLAVPQSIVGVVVAEMLAGQNGLGYLVARNAGMFHAAGTFASLVALLIIGFAIDRLMNWATKKPLEWKTSGSAM